MDQIQLTSQESADRLDRWLQSQFPDRSRSLLQKLIRNGNVKLNGQPSSPNAVISPGMEITIGFPPPTPLDLAPEDIPLNILFEDEHLLVVNKPAGLVVHPGAGHFQHTMVHALLHHCKGQLSGIGGVERPGIVHRLDRDTSGCVVIAKTDPAHQGLAKAFHERTITKHYLALVWGTPRWLAGKIDQPIGRHPTHRQKMSIQPDGRPALTEWKLLKKIGKTSWIECQIHSGRTHQIRVHMTSIGHPLVGDEVYGKPHDPMLQKVAGRQMLHAWKLSFTHPLTNQPVLCTAPIPDDMKRMMDQETVTG